MPLIDAASLCECLGTMVVAVELTVGVLASVSAVEATVKNPRLGMTGGGRLSVRERERERIVSLLFSDFE